MLSGQTDNPFASRFVHPRRARYVDRASVTVNGLFDRLVDCNWMAQILGPHGAGKSTLMHHLRQKFLDCGIHVWRERGPVPYSCHEAAAVSTQPRAVLLIESWETLSRWRRYRIVRECRRRRVGLVVACHRDCRLPTLASLQPCRQHWEHVVAELAGQDFLSRHVAEIRAAFLRHQGNMREALFDLYDLYERVSHADRYACDPA